MFWIFLLHFYIRGNNKKTKVWLLFANDEWRQIYRLWVGFLVNLRVKNPLITFVFRNEHKRYSLISMCTKKHAQKMCFQIRTQKPTQSAGGIDMYWSYVYLSAIENDFRTVSWRVRRAPIALRTKRALRSRFRFSICAARRTRYRIVSLINSPCIFGIEVRFVIGFTNIIMLLCAEWWSGTRHWANQTGRPV